MEKTPLSPTTAKERHVILDALRGLALAWGLPASALYAWSATEGHPWGLTIHSLLYAVSVIPLAFGYIALFCLLFMRCPTNRSFTWLATPGRMALSNYLSQSLIGVLLFYGLGFGLGCSMGLVYIELTALTVFAVQIAVSGWWLQWFRFGPLEWIWRMLTYGNYFKIYPKQKRQ